MSENNGQPAGSQSTCQKPNWTPYTITGRGVNSQGNKYDNRDEPSGKGYHYSNQPSLALTPLIKKCHQDGSYFYRDGDNATYHNDGKGNSTYTAPNEAVYKKTGLPETKVKEEAKTVVKNEKVLFQGWI
ncbi:hypothetical protein HYALB_00002333 [Hymenoscyphus albidus]|uniref:Uncharacterized protein n=1 Tax=Hymenoscyphus albidus TaxID=595503 RepID=A0A9N9M3T8_9HELO|nr:hypothetical protein HYALB_00002333 [Hymenoscyphus albidus]